MIPKSESAVLLRAEQIEKTFMKGKQAIPVLRGVDLSIAAGERVAITGASGVGKSTLLHILGTLEPPTRGRVVFGDSREGPIDLAKLNERRLARFRNQSLGFVFQFHYLLPEFSAVENVMMPALIGGAPRRAAETQAQALLEFVGLKHRLSHKPSELSGGEQQRVAIARSVILKPKLLLADELTGNLDSKNSEMVIELLVELNKKTGVSILMVTHDLQLAKKMERVVVMRDGRISH